MDTGTIRTLLNRLPGVTRTPKLVNTCGICYEALNGPLAFVEDQ